MPGLSPPAPGTNWNGEVASWGGGGKGDTEGLEYNDGWTVTVGLAGIGPVVQQQCVQITESKTGDQRICPKETNKF